MHACACSAATRGVPRAAPCLAEEEEEEGLGAEAWTVLGRPGGPTATSLDMAMQHIHMNHDTALGQVSPTAPGKWNYCGRRPAAARLLAGAVARVWPPLVAALQASSVHAHALVAGCQTPAYTYAQGGAISTTCMRLPAACLRTTQHTQHTQHTQQASIIMRQTSQTAPSACA